MQQRRLHEKLIAGAIAAGTAAVLVCSVYGLYTGGMKPGWLVTLAGGVLAASAWLVHSGNARSSRSHIALLTKLHLATIESLTMAIDAKDPLARGHIDRVRVLAEGLARNVDYPEEQVEGLKTAALLHDIGKLAVPEHILSKPAKLSSAEFSKIMIHPVVAADILSNVEFPYEVVPIVKHHHEKFDGTGYPSGLSGEQIPFGARILTIVDCYEALTTSRPYRKAFSREQALEMMRLESGLTFDPSLLDKFIEVIDSLEFNLTGVNTLPLTLVDVEPLSTGCLVDSSFGPEPRTRTERALLDIAAAQREVRSLYEISQTLGSTLKLSEVLPIVAAKLENVVNFTTLAVYLSEGSRVRAAYVIGKNADALKGYEVEMGEGGVGWVGEHRQVLIGGSPVADLEPRLGARATASYRSAAIFPLLRENTLVGALAFYCEEGCGFSADEIRVLETISSHAAAAVDNALTFERTQESALTDMLTSLPNSRYMYSFFDQERSRAERHGYPVVLMMMDLDGFKKVNDTYGHHVGDEILRQIANVVRGQMRSGDTLVRYAGDEFVAVLHRATDEIVVEMKDRVQSAVEQFAYEVRPGRVARIGISIGFAVYGQDGELIDELMEVADQRMYEDKTARKRKALAVQAGASRTPAVGFQINNPRLEMPSNPVSTILENEKGVYDDR
ncbi:MAG TPA: HD domain-containing phosphohydrolase [Blastocatellia bacterium]|nr:HD domain-containing phosphohydrolase [Blastocatellia bacterium]